MKIINYKNSNPIPLDCPVCEYLFRDYEDVQYYERFQCCKDCGMKWAEPNQKKWNSGWRPTKSEIEKFMKTSILD